MFFERHIDYRRFEFQYIFKIFDVAGKIWELHNFGTQKSFKAPDFKQYGLIYNPRHSPIQKC